MSREVVQVDKPWIETVPFSLGVIAEGRFLFTAGITARDASGKIIEGDVAAQIEQCFRNLGDVLEAAGASFGDVVKWTLYTTEMDAFIAQPELYRKYFVDKPASTLLGVNRLMWPEMLVEIEAVVRLP